MPPRRKAKVPDTEETIDYLDVLLGRLDRLGDRIEAYVEDPENLEGHHDTPPAA